MTAELAVLKVLAGRWVKDREGPLGEEREEYWRLAAAMAETVCEQVRWATGLCTGDGCYLGIADGSTLGGGTNLDGYGFSLGIVDESTLGGCTTLGGGTTLGVGTTFGGGVAVGMADGGVSAVLVFQWAKRSWSLNIADSCLWWIVVEASLTAQDGKFKACRILSL